MNPLTPVEVESPFSGNAERNLEYVRDAMHDCLMQHEAPIASHALYTQPGVLDDDIPEERELGMEAGKAWTPFVSHVVVYVDLGISSGMVWGIKRAMQFDKPVFFRRLREWKDVRCEKTHTYAAELLEAVGEDSGLKSHLPANLETCLICGRSVGAANMTAKPGSTRRHF